MKGNRVLADELTIRMVVLFSSDSVCADPDITAVSAITNETVTLYTGNLHEPLTLRVAMDGRLIHQDGFELFLWRYVKCAT